MKKVFFSVLLLIVLQAKAQIDPVKYPTYTSVEDAMKSGKTVYSMSFRGKTMFNLPVEIQKFNSIFFLNLMENKFEKMDESIFKLKELTILNLNENSIKYIPDEIAELQKLESFSINLNNLTSINPNLGKLKKLKTIHLDANNLNIFPEALLEIPALEEINLQGNQISFIAKNLDKIKNLKSLNLSGNQINDLGQLEFPKQLKYLELQQNSIAQLPDGLLSNAAGIFECKPEQHQRNFA